jgi:predicted MFS family arabinose efflux permease
MKGGLPRAVYPLYAIVFIDVLGFTFLIPLLPALGKHFAASTVVASSLISTTAAFAALSSPMWGYVSDHIGRKKVLLSSQVFTLGGYVLIALAGNLPLLFGSRVVAGLGGGNLGVAQSYIVDVVEPRDRDRALAYGTAAFGLGFIVGPILSGLLLRFGLSVPFWAAAGFETINILFTTLYLPDIAAHGDRTRPASLWRTLFEPGMLNLMSRQMLYIFAFTYFFTVFALYLDRQLHVDAAGASFLLAAAGAVGAATLVVGVDRLTKAVGTARTVQIGFLGALVAYALVGFVNSLGLFAVVLAFWAASGATLRPTLNALVADAAPPERRGAIMGFADSTNNLAMIFAPAIGGAVVGIAPRFSGVLPALCVAAGFMLGIWGPRARAEGK